MTEQEEFEFRRRAEMESAPAPATFRQKLQASAPMRVVQGARDAIDAGAQLLPRGVEQITSGFGLFPNSVSEWAGKEAGRVDDMVSENERSYAEARRATGQSGFDAARFAGNVVSPANAALAARLPVAASTAGRVMQGGLLGAAGGALTPVDREQTPDFATAKTGQIVLGAATGAVAAPALGGVADWAGKAFANRRVVDPMEVRGAAMRVASESGMDWGKASADEQKQIIDSVTKALKARKSNDPTIAARIADFDAEKMPYLQGQVTRDPRQFAREKNLSQLAGTGDPITERLMTQGAMTQQKIGALGKGASEPQDAGAAIAKALRSYDEKKAKEVSAAYRAARDAAGKDAEVPMQGIAQDFADTLDSFGDKIPSGVRNQFKKYGIEPGGDMTQRKLFTVEEADKLLKVISANQSNDPATNAALSALRNSVKKAVTDDAGVDDVFSPARKLAAQRFAQQDAIPALESAASRKGNPDTFVDGFIVARTARTEQVQQLAKLLREESPEAFTEARTQLGAFLGRKAFGQNKAGDKAFSPERYNDALQQLGTKKLEAFFSPEEVAQIKRLGRIGSYMESVPNASKPNVSGNWGAITSVAMKIPGMPTSLALAGALKSGVSNQMDVGRALAEKTPTQMTPEQVRLIAQILAGGSAVAGGAAAAQLK